MKIWIVSMECAGIVEAGGVKDVTYALCENFAKEGNDVTLFIPVLRQIHFPPLKIYRNIRLRRTYRYADRLFRRTIRRRSLLISPEKSFL